MLRYSTTNKDDGYKIDSNTGYYIVNNALNNYDLAIAVGGDGSFLRMVKQNNFNSDIYYIGINSGTLGFMQEVKITEIDKFIDELKNNKFKVEEIGIQETTIYHNNSSSKFYSLNEIVIRDGTVGIAEYTFFLIEDLVSITLPDSLRHIGGYAITFIRVGEWELIFNGTPEEWETIYAFIFKHLLNEI